MIVSKPRAAGRFLTRNPVKVQPKMKIEKRFLRLGFTTGSVWCNANMRTVEAFPFKKGCMGSQPDLQTGIISN